jgi:fibronectin type 3 domain-containing protein
LKKMKGLKKHILAAIAVTAVFAACVLTLGFNTQPLSPPLQTAEKAEALASASITPYEVIVAPGTPAEVPESIPVPEASSALPAPSAPTATPQVPATSPEVEPARPPIRRPDPVVEVINPPTNLQGEFKPKDTPEVKLTWDRNNPEGVVKHFLVYRVVVGEEEPDPGSLEPIGKTRRTKYRDKDIEPGLTYRYWVTAVSRQDEESAPSEPVVVETFTDQTPAPPQGLDPVAIDPGVSIDWQPNTEPNLAGYLVYKQSNNGRWRKLTRNPIADNHYYFRRGRVGQVYAVSAVNVYGSESEKSISVARPSVPVIYEESDPSIIREGLWVIEKYEGPTNGQILVAGDAGAKLHFHFTGRQVKMIVAKYWSCGSANVYLDGELVATVNMYSPQTTYLVVDFDAPGLKYGEHVLTLEVLGTGNPEVDHNFANIDAFEVR